MIWFLFRRLMAMMLMWASIVIDLAIVIIAISLPVLILQLVDASRLCTCNPPLFDVFVPGRFVRLLLQFSIEYDASENLACLKLFNIHDEHLPINLAMSALQVFQND